MLETIRPLFIELLVPPAVAHEISPSLVRPDWSATRQVTKPIDPRLELAGLGAGETEVIALVMELGTHVAVLDERNARRVASSLGVPVTGTVGLLLAAKQTGLIDSLAEAIESLRSVDFYISPTLILGALRTAEEANR